MSIVYLNQEEAAVALGMSARNLRDTIKRKLNSSNPVPVIAEGREGREYKFDPEELKLWQEIEAESEKEAAAQKKARVLELFGEDQAPEIAQQVSIADRGEYLDQEIKINRLRKERGHLIEKELVLSDYAEIGSAVRAAFDRLRSELPRRITLNAEQAKEVRSLLANEQRNLAERFKAHAEPIASKLDLIDAL